MMSTSSLVALIALVLIPSTGLSQEGRAPYLAFSGMSTEEATASQQAAARHFKLPSTLILELNGAASLELVLVPPGEFMMGGLLSAEETAEVFEESPGVFELEHPRHQVRITQPFFVGRFEITKRQWSAVLGGPQPSEAEATLPVAGVTWHEAQDFIQALSDIIDQPVHLLSEAEWEYACRAGSAGEFYLGDTLPHGASNVDTGRVEPVGTFIANAWGLHDMLGNVVEWVQDGYGGYSDSAQVDPVGPDHIGRMLRGGGLDRGAWHARCSYRYAHLPDRGDQGAGFRIGVRPHR